MIIVIDGPAGSGKSSTAREVANRLNLQYLDSGALYRAVTVAWLKSGKEALFFDRLNQLNLSFHYDTGLFRVWIDSEEVTDFIRTEAISSEVSYVATRPDVRAFVNKHMRDVISENVCIADGRDLGTAVFPEADLKIYMDANPEIRAKRRAMEITASGQTADSNEVLSNIIRRDEIDSARKADPLQKAEDAILVQTDDLSFQDQVELICQLIQKIQTQS